MRSCKPGLGNARYGEAVLGHALLQTGVRTGDGTLIDTALRSLTWVAEHPEYRDTLQTNFETWALASSYNIARRRIPSRPLFRKNRRSWERWLTTVKPLLLRANARRYFNHHLVEAVATFELKRTGLRSKTKGAVLHPRVYNSVERRAVRTVEDEVYAVARPTLLNSGGEVAAMVVLDAIARRLPGALREESGAVESFSAALEGGFEFPQYTRPPEFRGWRVPDVLLSGNHAEIERWRREEARRRTRERRPDL